jgi:hypothetical protein
VGEVAAVVAARDGPGNNLAQPLGQDKGHLEEGGPWVPGTPCASALPQGAAACVAALGQVPLGQAQVGQVAVGQGNIPQEGSRLLLGAAAAAAAAAAAVGSAAAAKASLLALVAWVLQQAACTDPREVALGISLAQAAAAVAAAVAAAAVAVSLCQAGCLVGQVPGCPWGQVRRPSALLLLLHGGGAHLGTQQQCQLAWLRRTGLIS